MFNDVKPLSNTYELLGRHNENSENLNIAIEEFFPNGSSTVHKEEEYQMILEGSGKLILGDQIKTVAKGDFLMIPGGIIHQIFNEHQEKALRLCSFLIPE